jgi:hypothetical protein
MSVTEPVNKFFHLWVLSLLTALRLAKFFVIEPVDYDIFGVPPPLQPVEGGGSVKGGKRNS